MAFLNEEGLARFCTVDYEEPNKDNLDRDFMHLTNFSINRRSENFVNTDELNEVNAANKRTLSSYWKSVEQHGYSSKKVLLKLILR